jgi:hypothetical protein
MNSEPPAVLQRIEPLERREKELMERMLVP